VSGRRAIIIDTDPGKDDAVAILLACAARDRLDIRAITVVAGNVPLGRTERNARALVELAGCEDIPVHAGHAAPLLHELCTAEDVHGPSGIDGADLSEPIRPLAAAHAVDAMIAAIDAAPPGEITLCVLGPLTNIAAALKRAPAISPKIREIVLMGGAIGLGNTTPSAEFNIYVDPHAADAVFRAGVPIVMFPLEATHQAILTCDWADHMNTLGTRAGKAIAGMFLADLKRPRERHGGRGVPLHDPCVIAYLLWPELFAGNHCHVAIETESRLSRGRTVVDRWRVTGAPPNALAIDRVDAAALFARLKEQLATLR
jgi:purine nucleosidase